MVNNVSTGALARDIIIGTIGPGASELDIVWCINDLMERHPKLWHVSLNHYRDLWGYTRNPNECPTCGKVNDELLETVRRN